MATRRLFDGATIEIGQVPIVATPAATLFWIKISGVWKQAVAYVKISGVWKTVTPYIKISGNWR